jgi:hypothetical protein
MLACRDQRGLSPRSVYLPCGCAKRDGNCAMMRRFCSALRLGQRAISSMVRAQPTQKWLTGSSLQTPTQGETGAGSLTSSAEAVAPD